MLVNRRAGYRFDSHRRHHVRRLDAATFDFLNIERVSAVDERAIPFALGVEIRTKRPVDKNVDDVSKRDEQIKMKPLDKERQNVLWRIGISSEVGRLCTVT